MGFSDPVSDQENDDVEIACGFCGRAPGRHRSRRDFLYFFGTVSPSFSQLLRFPQVLERNYP